MFKRAKVVMLSTNEKALIILHENGVLYPYRENKVHLYDEKCKYQHLYFLSDEEIKVGDWCVIDLGKNTRTVQIKSLNSGHPIFNVDIGTGYAQLNTLKKIIATTDKSLVIEGKGPDGSIVWRHSLPQPSQAFLEVFIKEYNKGNIITEVMVEYIFMGKDAIEDGSNIEILKINPKDNTITIRKVKDSWNKEEHSLNLQYCISEFAAERGLTPTSEKMKEVNDWVSNWIEKNL